MELPLVFTGCLNIQFFNSPHSPNTVRPLLVAFPSLGSSCMTYRTLCHSIDHQVLPTQVIPRETEDFPRGGKYDKQVPLLTYLIYFPAKVLLGRFYLCFGVCCRTLYQPLAGFEPTILLKFLYDIFKDA